MQSWRLLFCVVRSRELFFVCKHVLKANSTVLLLRHAFGKSLHHLTCGQLGGAVESCSRAAGTVSAPLTSNNLPTDFRFRSAVGMSERYAREVLRRNVAQICQTIGWNGIQSTPLDVLVHVLEKYVRTLGVESARRAEVLGRTEPNLHDLGLVFRDLNVHLPELNEYVRCVPPTPCPVPTERFPHPKESHLNFLKPGSHEVVTRPMHVHEHLPPMYPEKETPAVSNTVEVHQNGHESPSAGRGISPDISVTDSPDKKDPFKRPPDPSPLPPSKRPRLKLEDDECHTREISSVMMTMSGFLSPAREGKLPEPVAPVPFQRNSDKHRSDSHHSNLMRAPTMNVLVERTDKKSKLVNGKIMKSKKKDKHRSHSSKSKHEKQNRLPPDLLRRKNVIPSHNNVSLPAPRVPPPPPSLDNVRPIIIKQEPPDPIVVVPEKEPIHQFDKIPVPRKIPIGKSPLTLGSLLTQAPKPFVTPQTLIPPVEIKKEIIDEEEKLASQPDRSKINIFKRISKSKEDKTSTETSDKNHGDNFRIDNAFPQDLVKSVKKNVSTKSGSHELINNNSEALRLDKAKGLDLTSNEVISLDDDSFDMNPRSIKPDPDGIPVPVPVPINKLKQIPFASKSLETVPKTKKDKKHKDKRDKVAEKAAKIMRKQEMLAAAMAAHAHSQPTPAPLHTTKSPKQPKNESSKFAHIHSNFPFLPSGRGLMPGPGLIPNLIPGNDLYSGLANPALRGLPPNLLANPFALTGGPGLIPGPSFMPGPGLLPPGLLGNMRNQGNSLRPQFPLMRRPSLEVIPMDSENVRNQTQSQIKQEVKLEKHKVNTVPNILQKHNSAKSKNSKDNFSKPNTFKMPVVTPDVTIELNPPTLKTEAVKPEPPSPPVQPAPPQPETLPETSITEVHRDKDINEKKTEKLLKRLKKEKDGIKIKKKKDKKDKSKDKSEKRKDKEERVEGKEKIKKEKKEKKRDKERPPSAVEGLVPKLTLKLGSASPLPPSSPEPLKLNIKHIKKDPESTLETSKGETSREGSRSPELAQISALVTRPPKPKTSKHNHSSGEPSSEPRVNSPSPKTSNTSPPRKNRPPSGHSKYKRILFKPLGKRNMTDDESVTDIQPEEQPRPVSDKAPPLQLTTPYYMDEHGNKVWVCPACGRPDNGSPMIGCDGCDGWYHWVCVGITTDPGTSEDWFCKSCIAKRAAMVTALSGVQTGRKRGRKSKAERVKEAN